MNIIRFGLILFFLSFFYQVFPQNNRIDSLFLKLNNTKTLHQLEIYNQLSTCYQDTNLSKSVYYSEKAVELAGFLKDTAGLTQALYNLAYVQLQKGDNNSAFKNFTQTYHLYNLAKNKLGIAKTLDPLGTLFRLSGSFEKSLEYHLKALVLFKELNELEGIIGATNNLGIIYRNLRNKTKALSYLQEALILSEKSNSVLLSTVYNSIGSFYWYEGKYDSAFFYYRKALSIEPRTLLLKERHCAALNNIGNVHRSLGNLDSANYYYKLSFLESERYELANLSSITLKNFGLNSIKLGNYPEALVYINKSISIAQKANLKHIIRDNYLLLSEIYSKQGNPKKALECHRNYSIIQDSIFHDEQTNKVMQLEVDYILQQKEKDQAVLLKNIAEQNLQIQENKSLIVTLSLIIAFLLILSIIIYRLFKTIKYSAKNLGALNDQLEKKVLERTQNLQTEIEEHKHTAIALIKAKEKAEESDRLKSAFLANLSHEIRTPMNAIMGFADLLSMSDLSSERRDHFISIIHKSGVHLLSIINDIIEISKIEAGQIVPNFSTLDLDAFMIDLYNTAKITIPQEKDIELKLLNSNSNQKLYIHTDPVKLHQVIVNLIHNAIKFTEKGQVAFGFDIEDKILKFSVVDTGVGIDEKHLKMIFERFRQVEGDLAVIKGGSGLGLSISKAYVEMLGGKITVESKLGVGSTFSFTLPLVESKPNPVSIADQKYQVETKTDKKIIILIAEDDDINFFLFQEIMSPTNYQILRAHNGAEAVQICSVVSEIRLVLMDIKMPIMDGYEALKQIRQIRPQLKIIAQTSYALASDGDKVHKAGFNGYLTKPVQKDKLFELINQSLA